MASQSKSSVEMWPIRSSIRPTCQGNSPVWCRINLVAFDIYTYVYIWNNDGNAIVLSTIVLMCVCVLGGFVLIGTDCVWWLGLQSEPPVPMRCHHHRVLRALCTPFMSLALYFGSARIREMLAQWNDTSFPNRKSTH